MKEKAKVVVTDYDYPTLEPERKVLEPAGYGLIPAQCKTEEEVIAACKDADALIVQYAPITRRVIEALERCRVIARYGVGVDTVDLEAATDHGIYVANVPDYCVDEVSEQAVAFVLACARKIPLLEKSVRAGTWDFTVARPVHRIRGQKLGIVGLGRIGRRVALNARALGMEVLAYDPYLTQEVFTQHQAKAVNFEDLLRESDFVSIHAPLNSETYHMFGEGEFRQMKTSAFLINTARGGIVDREALYQGVRKGEIAGAAMDVLEVEPIDSDDPLLELPNIIITPHTSWYSEEAFVELKTKVAQEVVRVLKGQLPRSLVNPQVIQRNQKIPRKESHG